MKRQVEAALEAWRAAIRRRDQASDGNRQALDAEVDRAAAEFQRLSGDHMEKQLDSLHDAEQRRQSAKPSNDPYHEAARASSR